MSSVPIAEHALLSDCHSAGLVTRAGSVDWQCFPRFDSPSIFARLLDDGAGHWSILPTGDYKMTRWYLDQTLVLKTTLHTATGTVVLTDALVMGPGNTGAVDMEMRYEPRPEYGIVVPLLAAIDGGVPARGGARWVWSQDEVAPVWATRSAPGSPGSAAAVVSSGKYRPYLLEPAARRGSGDGGRRGEGVHGLGSAERMHRVRFPQGSS